MKLIFGRVMSLDVLNFSIIKFESTTSFILVGRFLPNYTSLAGPVVHFFRMFSFNVIFLVGGGIQS